MPTLHIPFVTLDVFTAERYKGNPLAICLLSNDHTSLLSNTHKHQITKEFNLSETVFLEYENHALTDTAEKEAAPIYPISIWILQQEINFAGHPTIGTAALLFNSWHPLLKDNAQSIVLQTRAGPILASRRGSVASLAIPHDVKAHAQFLDEADIQQAYSNFEDMSRCQIFSIVKGMTFALCQVANLEELATVKIPAKMPSIDLNSLPEDEKPWIPSDLFFYYFWTIVEENKEEVVIRTRMVEAGLEDPATGSAASALACYLSLQDHRRNLITRFHIIQGYEMGRRSDIFVQVSKTDGVIQDVQLEGQAVQMDDLSSLDFSKTNAVPAFKGKTAFDYLASTSSGSSSPVLRSPSPAALAPAVPMPPRSISPASQDAFSSLFDNAGASKKSALPMNKTLSASPLFPIKQSQTAGSRSQTPVSAIPSNELWDFDLLAPVSQPSTTTSPLTPASASLDKRAPSPTVPIKGSSVNHDDSFELMFDDVPKNITTTNEIIEDASPMSAAQSKPMTAHAIPERKKSSSPPPHVLGQLVEMGFSIQESRAALIKVYDGKWNVQAAAEDILNTSMQEPEPFVDTTRSRSSLANDGHRSSNRPKMAETTEAGTDLQADLLAQASDFGISVFKTANSYWKSGKQVVKKAYEERLAQNASTEVDERPKWMRNLPQNAEEEDAAEGSIGFKDSVPRTDMQSSTSARTVRQGLTSSMSRPEPVSVKEKLSAAPQSKIYQSSARRKVPDRTPSINPDNTQTRKPSYTRPIINVDAATLAVAIKHKESGNQYFKLGRYADAENSYSQGLDQLPESHLARLDLLNNRTSARLKNGSERLAVQDATQVLIIIFGHEKAEKIEADSAELNSVKQDGATYELRTSLGKALSKRAKAHEACENWSAALDDWQTLMRLSGSIVHAAGGQAIVSEGLKRARIALQPKAKAKMAKPVPQLQAAKTNGIQSHTPSKAVAALRTQAEQSEAEDNLRVSLIDSVDAKILAWKGGKENNVRALVASLDTVLWPDLGLKKVGMHELVTASQLKIQYMKAIAKLHPDKLDTKRTTVEQRMIANNVFSTLNDAWNSAS